MKEHRHGRTESHEFTLVLSLPVRSLSPLNCACRARRESEKKIPNNSMQLQYSALNVKQGKVIHHVAEGMQEWQQQKGGGGG